MQRDDWQESPRRSRLGGGRCQGASFLILNLEARRDAGAEKCRVCISHPDKKNSFGALSHGSGKVGMIRQFHLGGVGAVQ